MKRKSINDLIADKIIEMGIDATTQFDYVIDVEDLESEFNSDLINFIECHSDNILASIKKDERVAEAYLKDEPISFDMIFYWGYCLDEKGKEVLKRSKELNIDLEYEDIVDLGSELWFYDNTDDKERRNHIDNLINKKVKEDDYEL